MLPAEYFVKKRANLKLPGILQQVRLVSSNGSSYRPLHRLHSSKRLRVNPPPATEGHGEPIGGAIPAFRGQARYPKRVLPKIRANPGTAIQVPSSQRDFYPIVHPLPFRQIFDPAVKRRI